MFDLVGFLYDVFESVVYTGRFSLEVLQVEGVLLFVLFLFGDKLIYLQVQVHLLFYCQNQLVAHVIVFRIIWALAL